MCLKDSVIMKKIKLICLILSACVTCVFNGCNKGLNADDKTLPAMSIKPIGVDLDGVTGLLVAKTGDGSMTRADGSDDGSYVLYGVDAHGNIELTLFYYEVVVQENPDPNESTGEESVVEVQRQLSGALQLVPSYINDLGDYILFSECRYFVDESKVSEEVYELCKEIINNTGRMDFMVRKSDGALFDITYFLNLRFVDGKVSDDTYSISQDGELFVLGCNAVYKVKDNGDALDFESVTNILGSNISAFAMDGEGYIYLLPKYDFYFSECIREIYDEFGLNSGLRAVDSHWPNPLSIECYSPDRQFSFIDLEIGSPSYIDYSMASVVGFFVTSNRSPKVSLLSVCVDENSKFSLVSNVLNGNTVKRSIIRTDYNWDAVYLKSVDRITYYLQHPEEHILYMIQPDSYTGEWGYFQIADLSGLDPDRYDFSCTIENVFYGVSRDGNTFVIKQFAEYGSQIDEKTVVLDIPNDLLKLEFRYVQRNSEIYVIMSARTSDGGYWTKEYNLITGKSESWSDTIDMQVVTFFKIN